jgi:ABC-type transporter Mla subunit MlaD
VTRIIDESRRLDREEQDAEEAFRSERSSLLEVQARLVESQRRLDESLARLDRIRRQKRQLLSKGGDMVRRGLASLDEMEEVERQESNAVVEASVNGAFGVMDWNAIFGTLPSLEPLVDPGSSGGTPLISPGS